MPIRSRSVALPALCAALLLSPAVAPAAPVAVSPVGHTPLAGCLADTPFTPEDYTGSSEVDPTIAVNPTNPRNVVVAWQQDRWNRLGGARGHLVSASFDGGETWATTTRTGSTVCTGGGELRRSEDPWLTFGPDGTLYLLGTSFDEESDGSFGGVADAAQLARSRDGGLTWERLANVTQNDSKVEFGEKPSMIVDPRDPNRLYAAWMHIVHTDEHAPDEAADNSRSFRGPAVFSASADGGRSWSPPVVMHNPGTLNGSWAMQMAVLRDGTIVSVMNTQYGRANRSKQRGSHMTFVRSADGGRTWSDPVLIDRQRWAPTVDPLTRQSIRSGVFSPDLAHDPATDRLAVVWHDARWSGGRFTEIAYSESFDGGASWSEPVRASRTPPEAPGQALTPAVAIARDGRVGVTYYDHRFDGVDASDEAPLETDHFLSRCSGDCASEANWTETRLTPASFDLRGAHVTFDRRLYIQDYGALTASGSSLLAAFSAVGGEGDPSSIRFLRVP